MMSSPGEVNAIVHAVLWATVVAYALLFAGVFSRIMPLLSAALVLALLLLRVRDSPLTPTTAALLLGRHVYFDLGANDGDPLFTSQLRDLCTRTVAAGYALSCTPLTGTALTIFDGTVDLFIDNTLRDHVGSSILRHSVPGKESTAGKANNRVATAALDVVTLFKTTWPTRIEDTVRVKMDIEGAEFNVLTRALVHGVTRLWDTLAIEWHETNSFIFSGGPDDAVAVDSATALRRCLRRMA